MLFTQPTVVAWRSMAAVLPPHTPSLLPSSPVLFMEFASVNFSRPNMAHMFLANFSVKFCVWLCVCVLLCMCMHLCVCLYLCPRVHTCVCLCASLCVCRHLCVSVPVCASMCVPGCVCICVCMFPLNCS